MAIKVKIENENIVLIGPQKISLKDLISLKKTKNNTFLFIDGGDRHLGSLKKEKILKDQDHYFVGDGDSKKTSTTIDFLKEDQNLSDFAQSLKLIETKKLKNLYCLGLSGGRNDHFLAVLGESWAFAKKNKARNFTITFDQGTKLLLPGEHDLNLKGIFSLMSLENNKVKLTGKCEFPLYDWQHLSPFSSHALSNMGKGKIRLQNQKPIFLFLRD